MQVTITQEIAPQRIADLMVSALEGGSNYWIDRVSVESPDRKTLNGRPWYSGEDLFDGRPFSIGFHYEEQTETKFLTPEMVKDGFELMATKYPSHFADFVNENDDANTADVWLQLCLFGEVVYG